MHSHVLPIPPWTCTAVSQTLACGARAVRLRHPPGGAGLVGPELVDGPRRVQRDAERPLHQAPRLREQVLHRLKRSDRTPYCRRSFA